MTTMTKEMPPRARGDVRASKRATWLHAIATSAGNLRIPPSKAPVVAALATLIVAVGDALTTAETTFTLFYLAPLFIAVWYGSRQAGYVVIGLIVACSLAVNVLFSAHRPGWIFITWNVSMEAGLFVVFANVLASLRTRLRKEMELRMRALDQLRHADRLTTIGELAAGIAHELGTPLNVISGRASLIAEDRSAGRQIRQSADIILQQVDRSATIIRHLLDFARRGGTHREASNLKHLCRETIELFAPLARKSDVEIKLLGPDVEASCNRAEIQQVLSNLMTNAIHAMPRGGRLTLTTGLEMASVSGAKDARAREFADISVHDTGTGIAPDIFPQIFDPFFTTKDVGTGTGLGLSVSFGIVRDHGGWISVDTQLGEGTTFTVHLPAE